jgi:ribonuclease HI
MFFIYFLFIMAEKKRYVVREWKEKGIFEDRNTIKPLVSWVKWSKYKSFSSAEEAKQAFNSWWEIYYQPEKKRNEKDLPFIHESIAVDAACSSATWIMEYQWIDLKEEKIIFSFKSEEGTNNIWEFLAIVHGLSRIKKENKTDYVLYSDSRIAINRVRQGHCKTNFSFKRNSELLKIVKRAEKRLNDNQYTTQIIKRKTEERWEIPADFWRK